jgi:hypothetical protein
LNGRYIDGGVYQNNPSTFGRNIAQIIKPTANRVCLLSLGTGLGEMGFDDPEAPSPRLADSDPLVSVSNLFALFGVASTGGQEGVAQSLFFESEYTLSKLYYYRFQPVLDPNLNTELDNTTPAILAYYEATAQEWYDNDQNNINTFLAHLMI